MLLPGLRAQCPRHAGTSAVSIECNGPSNTPASCAIRRSRQSSCCSINRSKQCLLNIPPQFPIHSLRVATAEDFDVRPSTLPFSSPICHGHARVALLCITARHKQAPFFQDAAPSTRASCIPVHQQITIHQVSHLVQTLQPGPRRPLLSRVQTHCHLYPRLPRPPL